MQACGPGGGHGASRRAAGSVFLGGSGPRCSSAASLCNQPLTAASLLTASPSIRVLFPLVSPLLSRLCPCHAPPPLQGADLVRMTRLLLDALDWRVTCPTPALAAGLALQQLGGRLGAATHALTAYLLVRGAAGGAVRVGGRGGGC